MFDSSKDILFSIIVPIYNVENYLTECIQSIINQNFDKYELLLIDDGSFDNCPRICDEYAKQNKQIKVFHKENEGLVSARKYGAKYASGEYILNVDGDDCLAPNALELLSAIVTKYDTDVVVYGFSRYYNGKVLEGVKNDFDDGLYVGDKLNLLKKNILGVQCGAIAHYNIFPSVWSKAIKKDLYCKWQEETLNEIKMGEDISVTFPALLECKSIYVFNEVLYYYRTNEASMTYVYRDTEVDNLKLVLNYLENVVDANEYYVNCQLDRYAVMRIHNILFVMAKNINNLNQFKISANSIYEKGLGKYIIRYKNCFMGLKHKLFIFFLKHKCWLLIWAFYRRSNEK